MESSQARSGEGQGTGGGKRQGEGGRERREPGRVKPHLGSSAGEARQSRSCRVHRDNTSPLPPSLIPHTTPKCKRTPSKSFTTFYLAVVSSQSVTTPLATRANISSFSCILSCFRLMQRLTHTTNPSLFSLLPLYRFHPRFPFFVELKTTGPSVRKLSICKLTEQQQSRVKLMRDNCIRISQIQNGGY